MSKQGLKGYIDSLLKNGCSDAFIEAKCWENYRVYNITVIKTSILEQRVIYQDKRIKHLEKLIGI